MDIEQVVRAALMVSVPLLVFALGLRASFADAGSLFAGAFKPPHHLLRALLVMNVIVPIMAAVIAMLANLPPAVRLAMLAMAVSPLPPILPGKQLKFGARPDYVFGLLVTVSLVSIVLAPLGVELLGRLFSRETHISFGAVAGIVGKTILIPLLAGMAVRQFMRNSAGSLSRWLSRVGTLLLLGGLVPVLIKVWPLMLALAGNGTVLAIAALVALAILAGHLMGGPGADERQALAIGSPMRHPAVALAIAHVAIPDDPLAAAAILLYLLVAAVGTTLYGRWARKRLQMS